MEREVSRGLQSQQFSTFCRELRLLEVLEDVCDGILGYSIHKERTDSTRFAKGRSQTFETLHNLV